MPDDPAKGDEGLSAEDAKALREELDSLKEEHEGTKGRLDEANKQLMDPDYLEHLAGKRRGTGGDDDGGGTKKVAGGKKADAVVPDKDIDEMSNKELAGYIVQVIRGDFGKIGEAVDEEFGKVHTAVADLRTAMDIDRLAAAHPDFWDHKDQILALSRKNPHLTPGEAYKLVKHDSLEKGAAERVEADKKAKRRAGGSEKPGSGPVSSSTRGTKPKGFEASFEEAYDAAFGTE